MTKEEFSHSKEFMIFRKKYLGIKQIVQDTIIHVTNHKKKFLFYKDKRMFLEKDAHSYFFSYKTSTYLSNIKSLTYVQNIHYKNKLNQLKSGQYKPEIYVDLHGLTQYEAKKALGTLILICHKEQLNCAGIVHGHGKNILKKSVPMWLSNHPDVLAFYKAPKIFRNNAAIFVLFKQLSK
ncbi:hypothetical protein BUCNMO_077 [Buchnera aphidicola (Nipponaphis monzeni)]|uniref:Smr domain-containing protein n=1 Tax=Buchnera aphidicola (Nipponaphis monzeni) TaxID=2495405 RepID=A0A455T9T4_9GAMM|nr:endonuclease SmrB [Buchnera aphidicola]BBI01096.1 hypothetical protein BUCNMO_077 [Buchnera aphidicola (Nipponaphis monzeni)]